MSTSISFGSLEILGTRRPGETGLFIRRGGLQGWEGLPTSRREALARAMEHGENDVDTFLPARVVTVDGFIMADDDDDLRRQMQRVSGTGATGGRLLVKVRHHGQDLIGYGRRMLAVPEQDHTGLPRAEFQIQAICADPRKYAPLPTRLPKQGEATVIAVFHRGNFPALPVVEIPNAPASWTVTSPAGTHTITGATPGGTHALDMRTGFVTRNGVHMPGVGRGPLWSVPNDASWTHALSVPGRVLIPDTYI